MTEKYRYHFVDSNLVSGWSDDGGHVSWVNPFNEEEDECAEIASLFWTYIDTPEKLLEDFISSMQNLFSSYLRDMKEGDFDFFFQDEIPGRASLLYQLKRADSYMRTSVEERGRLIDLLENDDEEEGDSTKISEEAALNIKSHYLLFIFSKIFEKSIFLMRLDPVLLHAPEGSSFILGSSPMNIINPFFSGRHPEGNEGYEEELRGACLIMPLNPAVALCLYDPNIYKFRRKGGKCLLTEHDVDVLNMIQIYNGGTEYGFVYKGCGDIVRNSICRTGDTARLKISQHDDSYPFSTELSVCLVKAEAEDNFSSYYDEPVSPFVEEMEKYNVTFNFRLAAEESDYRKESHRRFVFAYNYLFEDKIEE